MVSLLKGKKPSLSFQNGTGSPASTMELLHTENVAGNQKKKKKKMKKKGKQASVVKQSPSSISMEEQVIPTKMSKTFVIGKKKIKCDKLLLNMLKKKRIQMKKALKAKAAMESIKDVESVEVVEQIPFTKKRKLSAGQSSKSEDKIPLLQECMEDGESQRKVVKYKNAHVKNEESESRSPNLPVTECRDLLIQRFKENDTLIVVGETGSGKSTQIPQFLIKDCSNLFSYRGMAITQPRRVAAISLANRVAYELGTEVGETVGFKVRFDKQVSDKTKITFLTDGYLMMDAIRNKSFDEYSVIIVDEAHERSVETDVVLSLLRNAQILRKMRNPKKQLKLIIMSATLDVDKFKSFFNLEDHGLTTKAVYVKGRPFSLQLNYFQTNVSESHIDSTWITLLKLHMELPANHHILVFLTGKEEIDLIVARANAINQRKDLTRVFVCPLYAALSKEAQMKSFELPPENTRKIVISTNLAETSLTIPGIRVVIDSGRVKSKYFEESLGMNVLRVQLISKSQSDQRAGRAGREFEGSVYRLYTKSDYEKMEVFPPPEITRSNLSRVLLLAAVSLGINDFNEFPLPDRPSLKAIRYALNELHRYGAIEANQQPVKLTRIARRLLSFPVELHLARVLYLAVQYQELSRVCAIIAMSTVETVYSPDAYETETRRNKYRTLWAPEGDFVTFWKIFKEYKKSKNKKSWCKEFGIQLKTMVYVTQVWRHLLTVCQSMELEEDERLSCGDAVDFKEKLLLIFKTAFSHQIARLSKTGGFYIVENVFDSSIKFHAKIHPTSSLISTKPGRLIFTHLSFNEVDNAVYMHNCGAL